MGKVSKMNSSSFTPCIPAGQDYAIMCKQRCCHQVAFIVMTVHPEQEDMISSVHVSNLNIVRQVQGRRNPCSW